MEATAGRRFRQWIVSLVLLILAAVLVALFWPVGLLIAGLLMLVTAWVSKSLPRPVRIALLVLGSLLAVGCALVMLDFATGGVQLTHGRMLVR